MRQSGLATGPAFVLVHGLGMSQRYFAPLAHRLGERGRVLSVDLPGFGGRGGPPALTMAEHAAAVCRALDHLGLAGATLVGHSMGCQVVAHALAGSPRLASRAVLLGPTVDDRARSVARQGLRLRRDGVREPLRLQLVQARDVLACGPRRYLGTVRHMMADRIELVLPSARVPVLVLRGQHDAVAPRAWAERLASVAQRGTAAEVPGARHVAQWTHPDEVAAAVSATGWL